MNHSASAQHELDAEKLQRILPDGPGVYLFQDHLGRVIYVGKAKNLKNRVLSYFKPLADLPHKTAFMMKRASGLDFIITSTEKEAFILESNLIKKFLPRYNIILRDDKQYPCLRINTREPYPRLTISRRIKKDGALYFGPFSSSHSVRSTIKVIDRVFQLRKCKRKGLPKRVRPCLNYQMDRCLGPCINDVPMSQYREIVGQVKLFLEGRNHELIGRLKKDMLEASDRLDFEKAGRIKDQIRSVEKTVERQHVVSQPLEDQDIIGLAGKDGVYQLVIFFVRKGYLVGSRNYRFREPGASASEVMEAFLKQFYVNSGFIPQDIFISESIEDLLPISVWLSDLRGKKVRIRRPMRGEKFKLIKMAIANAQNLLSVPKKPDEGELMNMLKSVLDLKKPPRYIEGLDISNLQGNEAVGTIVSFVDGMPHRSAYRNYRIRGIDGVDDYGMMEELVQRRISKGQLPDLFLVDGGKGHLSVVKKVIEQEKRTDDAEVVAIAKPGENAQERWDRLYRPGRKNPVRLRPDHPVLLFMMRIRDEAHRRAVMYHRKLRKRDLTESVLDHIPKIGIKRKKMLLKHFKDVESISRAGQDELAGVPGISRALAENIISFFQTKIR